jgi:hypothetical protein
LANASIKNSNKINTPGDVQIDEVRLVAGNGFEQSLLPVLSQFTIYEDLFRNGLSGFIIISDALNLVRNFPIIGEEDLYITIRTPGVDPTPKKLRFKVHNISTYVQGKGTTMVVRLEFVSPFVHAASKILINKAYTDRPYSEMVASVFSDAVNVVRSTQRSDSDNNIFPTLEVEPTKGNATVIVPNWTPLYAINWMTYRAVPTSNVYAADYIFYESLETHKFVSLSKLKSVEPKYTYKYFPGGARSSKGERMIETELRTINQYAVTSMGDKMKESVHGMFSSHMLVNEMTTKSYYTDYFCYRTAFDKTSKMNPNRILPYDSSTQDMLKAYIKYHTKSHYAFEGVEDTNYIDYSLYRQSLLQQVDSYTMVLDVFGDTSLRVGDMINVDFVSPESIKNKDETLDPYMSGRYIVTCIRHDVMVGRHTMRVTVSRDSLKNPLPDKKEKTIRDPSR